MASDRLTGQKAQYFLAKIIGLERLGDEGVGTAFCCPPARLLLGMGGEDEHGEVTGSRIGSEVVENLPTIHLGKSYVENEEIGVFALRCRQTGRTVFPHDDLEFGRSKTNLDEAPYDRGIFNYQHSLQPSRSFTRAFPDVQSKHSGRDTNRLTSPLICLSTLQQRSLKGSQQIRYHGAG